MLTKENGKTFLNDVRIKNGNIEVFNGRKKDLSVVYGASYGIGDLIGSFIIDMNEADYVIVKYGQKYALGLK